MDSEVVSEADVDVSLLLVFSVVVDQADLLVVVVVAGGFDGIVCVTSRPKRANRATITSTHVVLRISSRQRSSRSSRAQEGVCFISLSSWIAHSFTQ